jgi:hypothetical protein
MFVSSAYLRGAENLIREPVAPMLRGSLGKNGVARGGIAAAESGPNYQPLPIRVQVIPFPKVPPDGQAFEDRNRHSDTSAAANMCKIALLTHDDQPEMGHRS